MVVLLLGALNSLRTSNARPTQKFNRNAIICDKHENYPKKARKNQDFFKKTKPQMKNHLRLGFIKVYA